jgi:hypothetical protein
MVSSTQVVKSFILIDMKNVICPSCKKPLYEYFIGCHNCGHKAGWPETTPTTEQHRFFAKHGLQWVGGSTLTAVAPPASLLKDNRGVFAIGSDTPTVLSDTFRSGSAAINVTDSGASRLNQLFQATGRVGSTSANGIGWWNSGVRLALFDFPGKVHPYPDDVPGPNDTIIP